MKYFCISFSLFVFSNFFAQWTPQTSLNTLVASSNSSDLKSVGTVSGKTAIVFWKSVPGPVNYELRMQVLDANGQQMLGSDGVLVSNNMSMSTSTAIMRIATDQNENIYIGATGTNGGVAFAFKMAIDGTPLWGANGLNLGAGYMITIKPLSNGEAIIARNASNQILYQKYTAAGIPIWPSELQVSNGASNNKSPGDIFELSNQEFLLIFHTFSFGVSSTLWAQKYTALGSPIWSSPVQLSNKATTWNTIYSSAQDQNIVYYGYKAATGSHFDSYLQRIDPDGTLPWGMNGKDFDIGISKNEMDTRIAYQAGSNFVWSVCNMMNSAQSAQGVSIQKFDKTTGSRLFSDTAKVVYPIGSSRVAAGDLLLINDQPVFLMKDGYDNGATPTTLNACYLNANGDFVWTNQFLPMATFNANKSRIHFSKNAATSVVATFVEEKVSGSPKIYAQSQSLVQNTTTIQSVSACDSFTWANNITYTTSTNLPSMVYTASNGGDSTVILNLLIQPSTYDTTVTIACGSYNWNGNTYTDSGIYSGPTQNCATSILDLIVTPNTSDTVNVTACGTYNWNNQILTSAGVYQGPTINCHTSFLNLAISPLTSDTLFVTNCGAYNWNNSIYSSSGLFVGTTTGCHTSYLSLLVQSVAVSVTAQDMTISASATGSNLTYQWLDCATNLPITDATQSTYTAGVSGNYAVVVTDGTCSDTSNCISVSDASIWGSSESPLRIYPNPSQGIFKLEHPELAGNTLFVCDLQGRELKKISALAAVVSIDLSEFADGTYLLNGIHLSKPLQLLKAK